MLNTCLSRHFVNLAATSVRGRAEMDLALGAALGIVFVGLPAGFLMGYSWRDRISRARRIRYLLEHERRNKLDKVSSTLAPQDDLF